VRLLVRSIGVKIEKALRCSLAAVALSAALAFLRQRRRPMAHPPPPCSCSPSVAPATKLEKIILSKEAKVPSYRQGCQGVWLLIVAHGFEPSTHCDLAPEAEDYEFETGFDRVFFLHHSNEFVTYG
jgi:hypothetical protein